jgi:hypothetical protein
MVSAPALDDIELLVLEPPDLHPAGPLGAEILALTFMSFLLAKDLSTVAN